METKKSSRLRVLREARGLSLREAAKMAELDPAQLSRVERGLAALSVDGVRRLGRVLGLPDIERALRPFSQVRP